MSELLNSNAPSYCRQATIRGRRKSAQARMAERTGTDSGSASPKLAAIADDEVDGEENKENCTFTDLCGSRRTMKSQG